MANFRCEGRIALSAEQVYSLMVSPDMQERVAKQFKAISAKAKVEERPKGPLLTLEVEEPARKGSGTEKSTMRFDWDRAARACTWTREDHQHRDRVKVRGSLRLQAEKETVSRIIEEGEIEISIPLIGRVLAPKIAASIERKRPAVYAFWESLGKA
ncbi:MAG: DUF2505 family protein [Myxococcota bacterium]|nr:DUF2505 family protein [Myxococcota bacterium]